MSSRRRHERERLVEREAPVGITDPELADLITHLDTCGHPEWGYRVRDALRAVDPAEREEAQAEVTTELVGALSAEGYDLPSRFTDGHSEPEEDPEGAEDAPEDSEVKEEAPEDEEEAPEDEEEAPEDEEALDELPEIPEDASRDDLVAYAAEHLDLELPRNISRSDALEAIQAEIGQD